MTMHSIRHPKRRALLAATAAAGAVTLPTRAADSPPLGPFVAIAVHDIDAMLAWYVDVFGFTVHSRGDVAGRSVRFALLRQGQALLELIQKADLPRLAAEQRTRRDAALEPGFFKSGFVVGDLDAVFQRTKAAGATVAFGIGQPPGGPFRVFGLRDPEGNLLQVFGA